jgi:uncharacterized protein (DUF1697 family)
MATYVALLRGINVGGRNLIKMADLRACFEEHGFEDVTTHIASGNVFFGAPRRSRDDLAKDVERMLSKEFAYKARVAIVTESALRKVVKDAPRGFGKQPDELLSDVIFLIPPLTAAKAIKEISTREGVDEVYKGKGVLYYTRLKAEATKSQLGKISKSPIYSEITIRSWKTTAKLAEMLDDRD